MICCRTPGKYIISWGWGELQESGDLGGFGDIARIVQHLD